MQVADLPTEGVGSQTLTSELLTLTSELLTQYFYQKLFIFMKKITLFAVFLISASSLFAQVDRSFGIKTGLNFSTIDGPVQPGEKSKNFIGFNIGAALGFHFTDQFEVRTELSYSKKGTKYQYDGLSYFNFKTESGQTIRANGTALWTMNVNNSYLELPVLAVFRYKKFEVFAGPSVAVLLASSADGRMINFNGTTTGGTPITDFERVLTYDFRRDDPGEGTGDITDLSLDGQTVKTPSLLGAYHQYDSKDKPVYKPLDFGLNVGASVYLTSTLFLGARLNYGLTDVTNNSADRDLSAPDSAGKPVFRDDFDRNFTLSANLGFSF